MSISSHLLFAGIGADDLHDPIELAEVRIASAAQKKATFQRATATGGPAKRWVLSISKFLERAADQIP